MIEQFEPDSVIFTERAVNRMTAQLSKEKDAVGIRLSADPSGCSGLMYKIEFAYNNIQTGHIIIKQSKNLSVFIPEVDLPNFKGLVVDVEIEGLNESFIFKNPSATAVCGCGMSFSVE